MTYGDELTTNASASTGKFASRPAPSKRVGLRPNSSPKIIPALDDSHHHTPVWSVMIPTFNFGEYVQRALESVLKQDLGPEEMQIEVVDDHSTSEDIEAIVNRVGKGRVSFYRQPANVGATANWNTCIQRSRGRIIHILHGDDEVRPGFYTSLGALFTQHPEIGAAFCRHVYIDATGAQVAMAEPEHDAPGILENAFERIVRRQIIQCAAIAVKREAYERLGGFVESLEFTPDWEMWIRLATHYPIGYDPGPLACFRLRSDSETSRLVRTGKSLADIRACMSLVRSYALHPNSPRYIRAAIDHYTVWGYHTAQRLIKQGDLEGALALWREALKTTRSLKGIVWAALIFADITVARLQRSDSRIAQGRSLPSDRLLSLRERLSHTAKSVLRNR